MSFKERLEELLGSKALPDTLLNRDVESQQKEITLSLATARDWEYVEEFRGCTQVEAELSDVTAVAYLKVNSQNNPGYDLRTHRVFRGDPIERLYLYNTAQAGLSLTIRTSSRLTDAVVNAALQATLVSLDGKVATAASQALEIAALASILTSMATAANQALQATAAKQDLQKTVLDAINAKVAEQATLSALASAVATAAKQDSAQATLDLIKTKTDNLNVALNTVATQATLNSVDSELDTVRGYLYDGTKSLAARMLDLEAKFPPATGLLSAQDENTQDNVYETVLEVASGSGWLLAVDQFLTPYAYGTNKGYVKITIDGTVVVEQVLSIATFAGSYPGTLSQSYNSNIDTAMKYTTSLKVEHKSDRTGSGNSITTVIYT